MEKRQSARLIGQSPISQHIKSMLTGIACYGSLIGNICIKFSSLANPAQLIGTHPGGGVGGLAELNSDGIPGCSAVPLGIDTGQLQAVKSSSGIAV